MEIMKLTDVVVWAENQIEEMRIDLVPSLGEDEFEELEQVKEFEAVKKVVNEAIKRHAVYTQALKNDFANKAAEVKKLEKEIEGRKKAFNDLREEMANRYIAIETHNDICKTYENEIEKLEKRIEELKETMMVEEYNHTAKVNNLMNELEKTCKEKEIDLKNHNKRDMNLVDELAKKNDEIKDLKEEIEELKKKNFDDFKRRDASMTAQTKCICELEKKIKNQKENLDGINKTLEIRTKENGDYFVRVNNLTKEIEAHEEENKRLTEKIVRLKEEIERLKVENKNIRNEIEKLTNEGDDGREGFERYIKYIISEEEGKFKEELNKRFSEEVSKISIKRTEEELAKAKLNEKFGVGGVVDEFKEESEVNGVGRTSSGRYPWVAKIIRCEKPDNFHCVYGDDCPVEAAEKCKFAKEENNIPCGEDAIE